MRALFQLGECPKPRAEPTSALSSTADGIPRVRQPARIGAGPLEKSRHGSENAITPFGGTPSSGRTAPGGAPPRTAARRRRSTDQGGQSCRTTAPRTGKPRCNGVFHRRPQDATRPRPHPARRTPARRRPARARRSRRRAATAHRSPGRHHHPGTHRFPTPTPAPNLPGRPSTPENPPEIPAAARKPAPADLSPHSSERAAERSSAPQARSPTRSIELYRPPPAIRPGSHPSPARGPVRRGTHRAIC